jgi:hypothetical protein
VVDRQVSLRAVVAVVAGVAALAACGQDYEKGAGVYTAPSMTTAAPATMLASPATAPVQTSGGERAEDREHQALRPQQQRAVDAAEWAARAFLAGYLRYSYGQGVAGDLRSVSAPLRAELERNPPRVPPAKADQAQARLRGLRLSGTDEGRVILLAQVADRQSRYAVLLTVEQRDDRWIVTQVQ